MKHPKHTSDQKGVNASSFNIIFEQSPISTQIFSPDGVSLAANKAWEKLWGVPHKFAKGIYNVLKDQQLVETGIMPFIVRGFAGEVVETPAIKYEPPKSVSTKGVVAHRWVRAIVFPVKDEDGKIQNVVLQHEDVTDRKQAEEDKNDFISIATHELKTPVTSLKAYAEVLERRFLKAGDPNSAEHLAKMNGQLDRVTSLIGDLLDATKIEGGKLQMHPEKFNLNALIVEIVEELQRTTDRHTLSIENSAKKEITADRERIGQVLTNLIANAIKYSPREGRVVVAVKVRARFVEVHVQDFGVGIPKAKQAKLFERFYRVTGPNEKNTYSGLGLGLYISREIVERHGGRIWVKSIPGKGSAFYFTLPINSQPDRRKRVRTAGVSHRLGRIPANGQV